MHLSRAPAHVHARAHNFNVPNDVEAASAKPYRSRRPPHPGAREVLIEYLGERITWEQALDRHPHDPSQPDHTFYFHVDDGWVLDANVDGNAARWINHACSPNCFADEQDGRIFITAKKNIKAGDELFYDYGLVIDERYTPALKKRFECRCGTRGCRGTMLSPKR
ncbi:MAG: SET domain-containing protein-lysine N-methyltransferase [Burkholderiales bacterium]|nr:SET domain-containing protein-lysine N-methyltransferase [Burkholderiales bacterium]